MSTLTLTRPNICFDARLTDAVALVDWLDGAWGLIFSHPQDFATADLEADRWCCIVESKLEAADVRALRLHSAEQPFGGWIDRIAGAPRWLVLERRKRVSSDDFSTRAAALRTELARATDRFVAVVDDAMQLHRLFRYSPAQSVPSVLDVIAYTQKLRAKVTGEQEARTNIIDLRVRSKSPPLFTPRRTAMRLASGHHSSLG